MTSAVSLNASYDHTALPHVVRSGIKLGLIQGVLIVLFAVLQPRLDGMAETVVCGLILLVGIAVTIVLPGRWTRARTIEGIAGAAGIGFASAITFLVLDVTIFQPVHLYTNRWLEIGGGSNWWYHPVWWMVGTYLTWMGAWVQANQTAKVGQPNPMVQVMATVVVTLVCLAIGILVGVPGAGWNLGSFGVAVLPALALYTALTSIGVKRREPVRFVRGVLRILGWLLTPLVAWAASFAGAWLSAVISGGSQRSLSTIKTMVIFGAVSGLVGAWAWLRLLRRSPKLQEALAVAPDGTPLVALGQESPTDAK